MYRNYPLWYCSIIIIIFIFLTQGRQHLNTVQMCKCESPVITLIRNNLWPNSPTKPKVRHMFHNHIFDFCLCDETSFIQGFCICSTLIWYLIWSLSFTFQVAFTFGFMENLRALVLESGGKVNLQNYTRALHRGKTGMFTQGSLQWVWTYFVDSIHSQLEWWIGMMFWYTLIFVIFFCFLVRWLVPTSWLGMCKLLHVVQTQACYLWHWWRWSPSWPHYLPCLPKARPSMYFLHIYLMIDSVCLLVST